MSKSTLITTMQGVETPSRGGWMIASSPAHVRISAGALRRTVTEQRSLHGALVVDDLTDLGLTLSLDADGLPFGADPELTISVRLEPTRDGRWTAHHATASAPNLSVVSSTILYHGVFPHGARPVAVLDLSLRLAVDKRADERRSGRRFIEIDATLHAERAR